MVEQQTIKHRKPLRAYRVIEYHLTVVNDVCCKSTKRLLWDELLFCI